jgi:DMSO reductase anchor subunit
MKRFNIILLAVATLFILRVVYYNTSPIMYEMSCLDIGKPFDFDWYPVQALGNTVIVAIVLLAGTCTLLYRKIRGVK